MSDQLEENKRIAREWHELALRKPEEAVAKYLGPHYRQHNPGAAPEKPRKEGKPCSRSKFERPMPSVK